MRLLDVYTKCACIILILKCTHPCLVLLHGIGFQVFGGGKSSEKETFMLRSGDFWFGF